MGISSTYCALPVGSSSKLAQLPSESGREAGVGGRSLWVVQGLCELRVLASPLKMGIMGPPNAPQLTFSRPEGETRPWGPATSAPNLDATFL